MTCAPSAHASPIQPPPSASELLPHPCLATTGRLHWGWLLHQDKTADQLPRPEALAEDMALPTILFRPQQDFKSKATQVSPPMTRHGPPTLAVTAGARSCLPSPHCFLPPTLCAAAPGPTSPSLGLVHPALVTAGTTEPGACLVTGTWL